MFMLGGWRAVNRVGARPVRLAGWLARTHLWKTGMCLLGPGGAEKNVSGVAMQAYVLLSRTRTAFAAERQV